MRSSHCKLVYACLSGVEHGLGKEESALFHRGTVSWLHYCRTVPLLHYCRTVPLLHYCRTGPLLCTPSM